MFVPPVYFYAFLAFEEMKLSDKQPHQILPCDVDHQKQHQRDADRRDSGFQLLIQRLADNHLNDQPAKSRPPGPRSGSRQQIEDADVQRQQRNQQNVVL